MDLKTVVVSVAASTAAAALVAPYAVSVSLQSTSPGIAEVGHTNVTGNALAGRFGAGTPPSLARVQVSETGSLQGVRSSTASGVSVYGSNSAASGLGAGGYFTSSSVGGRAMVAEQLSTTGNTVGGLFYNRSTTGGVALWGKHIGVSGATTGIFGEVASTSGTAISGQNTASNNSAVIGTGTDSLKTTGAVPRHDYAGGATAAMVPIAYGFFGSGGGIISIGTGNWSVTPGATGAYTIDIAGIAVSNPNELSVVAIPFDGSNQEACTVDFPSGTGDFDINVWRDGNTAANSDVSFVVYRGGGFGALNMPEGLSNPAQLKRYGNTEVWAKKDPVGFEAWRKRYVAWQVAELKARQADVPVDSGYPRP
ncbi:MAG: hypothetical protein JST30_14100 [Armatimonadetes bacterium]|nr:hypothetical protein [Armatimonadota bacterium]